MQSKNDNAILPKERLLNDRVELKQDGKDMAEARKKATAKKKAASSSSTKKFKPTRGVNPDHLKQYQWKKGQTGNPDNIRGKTKINMTKLIQELGNEPCDHVPLIRAKCVQLGLDPKDTSIAACVALSALAEAALGDAPFFTQLIQRTDGKVPDIIEAEGMVPTFILPTKESKDDTEGN